MIWGRVTNIIRNFKKGLNDPDYESVGQLSVESRRQGFTLSELGSSVIRHEKKRLHATTNQKKIIVCFIQSCLYIEILTIDKTTT
ncbi:MAG: hypothetical protein WAM14_07390 [Candidatus Nitrosopolaris sp.]